MGIFNWIYRLIKLYVWSRKGIKGLIVLWLLKRENFEFLYWVGWKFLKGIFCREFTGMLKGVRGLDNFKHELRCIFRNIQSLTWI